LIEEGDLAVSTNLTSSDLAQWSSRRDAQGQLPAVIRQLIMSTVRPERIRFPADEGIALKGLDGILSVPGGAPPYVPAGDSAWEASAQANPKSKANREYTKRTKETPPRVRANTTFVFVTTRSWDYADWVKETKGLGAGWKDLQVLDAQDLATWLSMCPGVHSWLSDHLNRPVGLTGLARWFERWSVQTEPPTPAALLLAGRRADAVRLLNDLDGHPRALEMCAATVDEVVGFVAATLLLGPPAKPESEQAQVPAEPGEVDVLEQPAEPGNELARVREPAEIEALLARSVVVDDENAWRRWCHHAQPQILIPLFYPDTVQDAIDAGHHVVLPRVARNANDKGRLAPLRIDDARAAWTEADLDYPDADAFARASRRNLRSLRRRIARHRSYRVPEWATGSWATLLATALLAGGWDTHVEGDKEVVLALTDRVTWRSLARDLAPLTSGDDPPLSEIGSQWMFIDVVDAWDALVTGLSAEDLKTFIEQAPKVLTEVDPALHLTGKDLLKHSLDRNRARPRYSKTLRNGIATTLAILGAVIANDRIAGNLTGANIANIVVREVLADADSDRWLTLSGLLPLLAEAAPEVFLDAVEKSLRSPDPTVMALFNETDDGFGLQSSHHSPLLWALEALGFAPTQVSRVATVLAKLTELDPGGKLANRPQSSLTSLLHLRAPQGAVGSTNRLSIIDAIRRSAPAVATAVMTKLVTQTSSGMLIRSGPRYRDWPTPRTQSTYSEIVEAIDGITDRLLEGGKSGLMATAELIGHITPIGRTRVLDALTAYWEQLSAEEQAQISKTASEVADRHRRFPEARWSMSAEGVAQLDAFFTEHGAIIEQSSSLFSWRPKNIKITTEEGRDELQRRRIEAVQEVLGDGMDGVLSLAEAVKLPSAVGYAVGQATTDLDDQILDLIGSDDGKSQDLAIGLVNLRSQTPGWLAEAVEQRPDQAGWLVLTQEATSDMLELVASISENQQKLYWSRVDPVHGVHNALDRFVDGLLAADRPYSAIDAVALEDRPALDLMLRVLRAPIAGTQESLMVLGSAAYEIGKLLDELETAGASGEDLAPIEFFYLPLLTEMRLPRALHQQLAQDAGFFADVISHMRMPDPPTETELAAVAAQDSEAAAQTSGESAGDEQPPDDGYQFSNACWHLIRSWREPLPGATYGTTPDADRMHTWVLTAREQLAERNRAGIASIAIGEALAGITTDPDGTWPCAAVRDVLERELDDTLENQLAIARTNQLGVTMRGVYDGGAQERTLADKYRRWANHVREQWPRTGKMLDEIAVFYDADARREDESAERHLHD
jgi:hypothetical protein